ncbi:MAG TPA: hypothetical protein QF611_14855 [Pseudomonadales bacterium]|nr:hypothetical protein [Pseudomonadales bacterium]
MLESIEGTDVARYEWSTTGQLGLVIGFERDYIQPISLDSEGAWVLGTDIQPAHDRVKGSINDRHLVERGQGHVSLLVAGKGDTDGFIEARGQLIVHVLDGGDHLVEAAAARGGINDTDGV